MLEQEMAREKDTILRKAQKKLEEEGEAAAEPEKRKSEQDGGARKRRRWDDSGDDAGAGAGAGAGSTTKSEWDEEALKKSKPKSRWDQTPLASAAAATPKKNRWDQTPVVATGAETPMSKKSRWDETPVGVGATPMGAAGLMTPQAAVPMTPELASRIRLERELEERNRPLTDEELDAMFPEGYRILEPPANYKPIHTPSRKLLATPTPLSSTPGFVMDATPARDAYGIDSVTTEDPDLPPIKAEDFQYFGKLTEKVADEELTQEEIKERKIMRLLLKVSLPLVHYLACWPLNALLAFCPSD